MSFSSKPVVIDAKNHMLGRLSSVVAKALLHGMLPHKLWRGKDALERLKVFEGIPPPYDKQKRQVVPVTMRSTCLKSRRKYCKVGRISHEIGWKHQEVIKTLEGKRKAKAKLHHKKNKVQVIRRAKAMKVAAKKIAPYQKIIESYGHR